MNAIIACLVLVIFGAALFLVPAQSPGALTLCFVTAVPTLILLARSDADRTFLIRVFVLGILVRILVATIIFAGNYEEFFGGDANTYDMYGKSLAASWHGDKHRPE